MVVPTQHLNSSMETETETETSENFTTSNSQCASSIGEKKDFGYEGEFYWSRSEVGYILGAFFYAYIPMQILGGWMADRFGIRHVLGTGMLIGGILSLLTPVAARLHYGVLIALRVIMGFSMGVTFPCVHSSIAKWVPDEERGTYMGFVFGASSAGLIISFLLSGYLCQMSWTYVFYILGGATIVWYIALLFFVYSRPEDHPRISEKEQKYIRESYKRTTISSEPVRIPWKSFLTSPCVWGMCISHFALVWLFYTVNTAIPLFMQDIMFFKIKENGVLSSLPSVIQMTLGPLIGFLCDLVLRKLTSRRIVRKSSQTIFTFGSGIFSVLVSYMSCEQRVQAVVLFCLIYFFFCFTRGGSNLSFSDVAPRFAGTVYGLANLVGNFPGFLVPIAIGTLTPNGTQAEWQKIFFLAAGILAVGWLCFMFLVGTEELPWAKAKAQVIATEVPDDDINLKPQEQNMVIMKRTTR